LFKGYQVKKKNCVFLIKIKHNYLIVSGKNDEGNREFVDEQESAVDIFFEREIKNSELQPVQINFQSVTFI